MDVKLAAFSDALDNFDYLTHADLTALASQLDHRIIDGLQYGIVQKFKYIAELCWKAIKVHLKEQNGIDESSPKKVVKTYYLEGYIGEDDYLLLIQAIEDRNRLSHVYDEDHFRQILNRLPDYTLLYKKIRSQMAGTGG